MEWGETKLRALQSVCIATYTMLREYLKLAVYIIPILQAAETSDPPLDGKPTDGTEPSRKDESGQ